MKNTDVFVKREQDAKVLVELVSEYIASTRKLECALNKYTEYKTKQKCKRINR